MEKVLVILVSIAMIGCFYLMLIEAEKWEEFKVEHKCKVVAHIRGSTSTGFSSSGNIVTVQEADKTGWLCNDGVTYYR